MMRLNLVSKKKTLLKILIACIIPFAIIVLFSLDIYDVYFGSGDYPFGSEAVSDNPIYASRNIYVSHGLLTILLLLLTVFFAVKQKWRWYFIILFISLCLIYYPMATMDS